MPRWAARYVIETDSVKVQRLQDITEEDAVAEGLEPLYMPESWTCMPLYKSLYSVLTEPSEEQKRDLLACVHHPRELLRDAHESYLRDWNAANCKSAPSESNPWIECYTFHLEQP